MTSLTKELNVLYEKVPTQMLDRKNNWLL